MLNLLPTRTRTERWIALVVFTVIAVAVSVGMAVLGLSLILSGDPDALRTEGEIWTKALTFSAIIPAVVCPLVVHTLLKTMRALHEAKAELEAIARRDPLTGLLNRRGFDEAAAALVDTARGRGGQIFALLCDIDHFKRINDTHGHDCGDLAIRHVATLLRTTAAGCGEAVVGRQGGEEFAAVLAGRPLPELARVAEAVRMAVASTPFVWNGAEIHLTVSVGTASAPPAAASVKALLTRADAALYDAKKAGRNRVVNAPLAIAA